MKAERVCRHFAANQSARLATTTYEHPDAKVNKNTHAARNIFIYTSVLPIKMCTRNAVNQ